MGTIQVRIEGDGQAAEWAARLIRAGDGKLKSRLYDAIASANQGIEADIRLSALDRLPKRGGLAASIAASRISVRRTFGDAVGISINVHHEYDIAGINDDGLVIHPTFGHLPWRMNTTRPGWFDHAMNGREIRTRKFIDRACELFAKTI